MLFEIHDIILHRLWKHAKRRYTEFVKTNLVDITPLTSRQVNEYVRLSDWEATTRRWYMNHQHKLHFVFP